jgi:hypothetical protein
MSRAGTGTTLFTPAEAPSTGRRLALIALGGLAAAACTPTVQLKAPEEPITINLNIQADVRVKIEEAAEQDIASNPDIFGE